MKGHRGTFFIALLALFFCAVPCRSAEMLRWIDDKGVVHFTDSLQSIPQKFRSKATRIKTSSQLPPVPMPADKASVPFQKKGELMIVQATLNEKAAAKFVVDTGASYTTISQATAKELEIDLESNPSLIPLQTANGVIQAPLVSVHSIEIGGLGLKDLTVAVHDVFPDPAIAGLLGLNFLSQFRLDIDSKAGVLRLEKK